VTKVLKVLLVGDSEDDERLVLRELERGGYEVLAHRVQTADALRQALTDGQWDVVISEYATPQLTASAALSVLKDSGVDIPFIIVSGTPGEETAVEALHAGAHDFLVKSRLARLNPAVARGIRDAQARRVLRSTEAGLKGLEAQEMQSHRMDAIGRVARGVAHDFNNILTAIIATADLSLSVDGLPAEVKTDLETIRDSGRRAAAITRQLLTFSRQQVSHPRRVDLNEVVRRAEPLLRRLVDPAVTFEIDLGATGAVEADPAQLEQLLVNLVVNAGDAMPKGGTVSLSTADLEIASGSRHHGKALLPGRYVALRVHDTGSGMDEDTLAQIFEPFFTTKAAGGGIGLGLATVYGIVNQSTGHVFVLSRPGEGALFEVCLPRVEGAPVAPPITAEPHEALREALHGNETILVVEDEAPVRAPICRALRQLGYLILEAKHGEDALIVLHEHHAPIHLLITDLVMPEMSGSELVRLLRDWYPNLKVLVISGYSVDMNVADGASMPETSYLPKPFTTKLLVERVREMLDSASLGH